MTRCLVFGFFTTIDKLMYVLVQFYVCYGFVNKDDMVPSHTPSDNSSLIHQPMNLSSLKYRWILGIRCPFMFINEGQSKVADSCITCDRLLLVSVAFV